MGFWPGERLLQERDRIIQPFSEVQVDCNAYTLKMGDRYYRTADRETEKLPEKTVLSPTGQFYIPPGQFAFLLSEEAVKIPKNAMAFISMRLSTKLRGLINVSGFNVDPGYEGKLIYGVYNAGPSDVPITRGDPIFKIWFCDLAGRPPDIIAPSGVPMWKSPAEGIFDIDSELIAGMSRKILSLQSLSDEIGKVRTEMAIQRRLFGWGVGLATAVFVGLLLLALRDILPGTNAPPSVAPLSANSPAVAPVLAPAPAPTAAPQALPAGPQGPPATAPAPTQPAPGGRAP